VFRIHRLIEQADPAIQTLCARAHPQPRPSDDLVQDTLSRALNKQTSGNPAPISEPGCSRNA